MSWVKQSDTLWRDYEFNQLTDGAQALWHRANSYIADNLTDGLVPESALKQLNTRKRYVDELVTAGRWVWQPAGGWLAVGWQEIIRSKAEVLAKRDEQKQRDSRKSPRQPAASLLPPGPVPVPINSNQIATAETDTSVRDTPKRILASKGRQRLRAVAELELDFDHAGKWEHALSVIAHLPAKEWAAAAAALKSEVDKGNRRLITPQSIVDNWHHWRIGEVPGQRKPIATAKPAEPQRYRVIANGGA